MIEYVRISISSFSAKERALDIGRTLNPTMIASEAEAKRTSDSVMAPTPL